MCVNTRIHTHTREYYIVNRTKCMCTYIFICIYLNVIGMIFTLSNSELHFETVYTILISRALSFPLVPARGSGNDFAWEAAVLFLCRARSTLTYGSTKVHRLRHPALVVLLLTPVYQIIEACLSDYWHASCFPQNVLPTPGVYVILPRPWPDILIQSTLNRHYRNS